MESSYLSLYENEIWKERSKCSKFLDFKEKHGWSDECCGGYYGDAPCYTCTYEGRYDKNGIPLLCNRYNDEYLGLTEDCKKLGLFWYDLREPEYDEEYYERKQYMEEQYTERDILLATRRKKLITIGGLK